MNYLTSLTTGIILLLGQVASLLIAIAALIWIPYSLFTGGVAAAVFGFFYYTLAGGDNAAMGALFGLAYLLMQAPLFALHKRGGFNLFDTWNLVGLLGAVGVIIVWGVG